MQIPSRHAKLEKNLTKATRLLLLFEGFEKIRCINGFEDGREIANIIANLAHELDIRLDVMANQNDVPLFVHVSNPWISSCIGRRGVRLHSMIRGEWRLEARCDHVRDIFDGDELALTKSLLKTFGTSNNELGIDKMLVFYDSKMPGPDCSHPCCAVFIRGQILKIYRVKRRDTDFLKAQVRESILAIFRPSYCSAAVVLFPNLNIDTDEDHRLAEVIRDRCLHIQWGQIHAKGQIVCLLSFQEFVPTQIRVGG